MFENIPEWLAEKVEGLKREIDPSDRETIYYAAAGWTISWYLRTDIQSSDVDEFFDPPGDEPTDKNDSLWHAHVNRAILVAETLFLLRRSPGFSELRKRLAKRKLKPSFFEMLAAKQFFKAGFEVDARPPVYARGQDFDFLATRGGEVVNVEVTALEADQFSDKTILNALRDKRKQLPDDAPAVIYCVIPERWLVRGVDWEAVLSGISENFLTGTRRINAIVFWAEEHLQLGGNKPGDALILIRKPCFNPEPRHPIDLSFLFEGWRTEKARQALATGDGLETLEEASYDSEFFRWVDHMVPPPNEAA